jgi:hypothetical protein
MSASRKLARNSTPKQGRSKHHVQYLGASHRAHALKLLQSINIPSDGSSNKTRDFGTYSKTRDFGTYSKARDFIIAFLEREQASSASISDDILFLLSCALSDKALPGYATLEAEHIRQIDQAVDEINRYYQDTSKTRPLNFLLHAAPGSGKSQFIRCIGNRLGPGVTTVIYNMTAMQKHEDLVHPLDEARNVKISNKLPLLFLDEIDANPRSNYPLLLPLLGDGGLTMGRQDLKLGKIVIVLAGSSSELPRMIKRARTLTEESSEEKSDDIPKVVDLLSRVNGAVLEIPKLSEPARRADKVCIAVRLLRGRFGRLRSAPISLFRFIAHPMINFRYGVRSMQHLIDLLLFDWLKSPSSTGSGLPLGSTTELRESSLAYHLQMGHDHEAHDILELWAECSKRDFQVRIASDTLDSVLPAGAGLSGYPEFLLRNLEEELQRRQAAE